MNVKTKVMIVEDDTMAMRHLMYLVEKNEKLELKYSIESASTAEIYCAGGYVDLILMDIVTALGSSGLDAAIKIKKSYPNIKIIILTSQLDAYLISRAKAGGVEGFTYKTQSDNELINIMDKVIDGEIIYPENVPKVNFGLSSNLELNEQQLNVLRELCGASTDEEISDKLNLSVNTVRKYIQQMLIETGFHNRTQLAVEAQKLGIVTFGY